MAHEEGGHGAQQDGGAGQVGLLRGAGLQRTRQCQALLCRVWPHLALELTRLQSGGHLHRPRLLQPPVDDEVEGEQRQEREDGGRGHPGPGRVPHDVVLRAHSCEGTTKYVPYSQTALILQK